MTTELIGIVAVGIVYGYMIYLIHRFLKPVIRKNDIRSDIQIHILEKIAKNMGVDMTKEKKPVCVIDQLTKKEEDELAKALKK